jgi:hypothetical protein
VGNVPTTGPTVLDLVAPISTAFSTGLDAELQELLPGGRLVSSEVEEVSSRQGRGREAR